MKTLFAAAAFIIFSAVSRAGDAPATAEDVRRENLELRRRVEALESRAGLPALPAGVPAEKPAVSFYGSVKADVSWDSGDAYPGNYALYVGTNKGNQWNATANQTRLGLNLSGPDTAEVALTGKIEMDFYGGGAENKPNPMMRQAYLQMDLKQIGMKILAGQAPDVISPLSPNTLNYTVLWDAGNIGYRRPQLRLTKDFELSKDVTLDAQAAVSRTIGDSALAGNNDHDVLTPQGRVAVSFPCFLGADKATVGLSGHYGVEKFTAGDMKTFSLNMDVNLPIAKEIKKDGKAIIKDVGIKGEFFYGRNLDTFFGGIGQGVNSTLDRSIMSLGGWAAASATFNDDCSVLVGIGVDDPNNKDLNTNDRSQNFTLFGNAVYKITPAMSTGFELSWLHTAYKNGPVEKNVRLQASMIYTF
jgi:hypothetical protein